MVHDALPDVVEVEYHFKNSVHIFTSLNSAGLVHIDSSDREVAYGKIGPVLSRHFSAFCGHTVTYAQITDYKGFCDVLDGRVESSVHNLAFRLEGAAAHC